MQSGRWSREERKMDPRCMPAAWILQGEDREEEAGRSCLMYVAELSKHASYRDRRVGQVG